jgi:hypothetical protein
MESKISVDNIAWIAHEVECMYCVVVGKPVGAGWGYLDKSSIKDLKEGIKFIAKHPEITPKVAHTVWVEKMEKEGWKYGEKADLEAKVHPDLAEYDLLPSWLRMRDQLVSVTIKTLLGIGLDE